MVSLDAAAFRRIVEIHNGRDVMEKRRIAVLAKQDITVRLLILTKTVLGKVAGVEQVFYLVAQDIKEQDMVSRDNRSNGTLRFSKKLDEVIRDDNGVVLV